MSVSEDMSTAEWADTLPHSLRGDLEALEAAYFRHVDAGDVGSTVESAPSTVFREHVALALRRPANESVWRVHDPADGSQIGAAVQIVTDDMPLLVKSVTTTLARLGASFSELIHPIFDVSRNGDGALQHVLQHEVDGSGRALDLRESWMHLQLHPSTDSATLQRIAAAIPELLVEVRHVVEDTSAMRSRQREFAAELDAAAASGRSPYPSEKLSDCVRPVAVAVRISLHAARVCPLRNDDGRRGRGRRGPTRRAALERRRGSRRDPDADRDRRRTAGPRPRDRNRPGCTGLCIRTSSVSPPSTTRVTWWAGTCSSACSR